MDAQEEGKKVKIVVDSNAWNFLYASSIDLHDEKLGAFEFQITLEIKRELDQLDGREDKKGLYDYFLGQTEGMDPPLSYFGFADSDVPDDEQRNTGFGVGGLASIFDAQFMDANRHHVKSKKRKIYYVNEADLLIAARAGNGTYILTEDNQKPGPLQNLPNTIRVSQSNTLSLDEFKCHLEINTQ
ncbi:hypothetical protein SOM24_02690 [Pantoea agglomerans]|jgi:hypothetical protein|uniref:hypothetical protein n=1 Tax=Enterobacter agglomerans TaxID=549 RepID=UPI001781EA23|nr:hypothetical protein [Pantoea agglomerans]MBD8250887.1 hypothetical protein [Pantoea agglomerans]MDY0997399.1 hypothetical protein [Pantoea agglomerans]WAB85953.1 hypothetical protein OSE17_12420 [Pantoea agglomerans]